MLKSDRRGSIWTNIRTKYQMATSTRARLSVSVLVCRLKLSTMRHSNMVSTYVLSGCGKFGPNNSPLENSFPKNFILQLSIEQARIDLKTNCQGPIFLKPVTPCHRRCLRPRNLSPYQYICMMSQPDNALHSTVPATGLQHTSSTTLSESIYFINRRRCQVDRTPGNFINRQGSP